VAVLVAQVVRAFDYLLVLLVLLEVLLHDFVFQTLVVF